MDITITDRDLIEYIEELPRMEGVLPGKGKATKILFDSGVPLVEAEKLTAELIEVVKPPCVDCELVQEAYNEGSDDKQGELDDAESDISRLEDTIRDMEGDHELVVGDLKDEIAVLKTAISEDLTTIRDLEDKVADLTKGD